MYTHAYTKPHAHIRAYDVVQVTGFVEKNRDSLFSHLQEILSKSGSPFLSKLFPPQNSGHRITTLSSSFRYHSPTCSVHGRAPDTHVPESPGPYTRLFSDLSTCTRYRTQLNRLMNVIDKCEPWYIRCIKANPQKAPNLFDTVSCSEQLNYSGVYEAVQIRKSGYPFRFTHLRFVARYRFLVGHSLCMLGLALRLPCSR